MSLFNLTQSCLDAGFTMPPITIAEAVNPVIAETVPIIGNQGPTNRCYLWFGEGKGAGQPPIKEEAGCTGPDNQGGFTLMTNDWKYPQDFNTAPGYAGSVTGDSGSPLTVELSNSGKGLDCARGPEINLGFNYAKFGLADNVATLDINQYDEVIVEFDIVIKSATTATADCSCMLNGKAECPAWWKTQFFTDLIFYQGPKRDLGTISIRNFDPQNNGEEWWPTRGADPGFRYQFSDHQVSPTSGATAHVKVDAKKLIHEHSSKLCLDAGSLAAPINFRAIQFVSKVTGGDMTFTLANVKANAFKYAAGTFTSSAAEPGCTPLHCPVQPSDPTKSCGK